jgi:glycosyltransferase involved in cell wall biosynthesis
VLCQSYRNFELIICDDASKDATWNIIQQYKDPRIRAYRNEKNIGEYPNRNSGIVRALGEYLIFIDGDDMMYPHGLEFMVKMLHAFPDCGMALMRWFKNNLFYPVVITPHQFYTGVYFGYGFNDTAFSNILFRTKVLKEAGGLSNEHAAGDDYVRLAIAAAHPTLLIIDNLTWWRETPGQASTQLSNSDVGIISGYKMKMKFLLAENCPLSANEKELAKINMSISLSRYIVKQILKLNWKRAIAIIRSCEISVVDLLEYRRSFLYKDPFESHTAINPLKMEWQKNPFTNIQG